MTFRDRIIGKYKAVLERTKMARESKRKQKVKAKKLAKEQMQKNLETYELAKKRLLRQGRVKANSVFVSSEDAAVSLPSLMRLGDGEPLDPIGGLNPFGEMDIDDEMDL